MIQISYDNGNPWLIVERDKTQWKVTIILYSGDGSTADPYKPAIIGEGEGWDYYDAYNLAQADASLQVRYQPGLNYSPYGAMMGHEVRI